MKDPAASLTSFLSNVVRSATLIDVAALLAEFDAQAAKDSWSTRSLFVTSETDEAEGSSQHPLSGRETQSMQFIPENGVPNSSQTTMEKPSRAPKYIEFVYPSEEEIVHEIPSRKSKPFTSVAPVVNDNTNVWDLVKSTQEFEETMSAFNLTQLMSHCEPITKDTIHPIVDGSSFSKVDDTPPHPSALSSSMLFTTTDGRRVNPSKEALLRARNVLVDDISSQILANPLLPAVAKDNEAEDSIDIVTREGIDTPAVASHEFLISTTIDGQVDFVTKDKETHYNDGHPSDLLVRSGSHAGFVTASGRSMAPTSFAALQRARLLISSDTTDDIAGIPTDFDRLTEDVRTGSPLRDHEADPLSSQCRGTATVLTEPNGCAGFLREPDQSMASLEDLQRACQMTADDAFPKFADPANLGTDGSKMNGSKDVEAGVSGVSKSALLTPDVSVGFKGTSDCELVHISFAALQRARQLFTADETPESIVLEDGVGDAHTSTITNGSSVLEGRSNGFVKASGRSLAPLSSAALQRARLMLADDTVPEIVALPTNLNRDTCIDHSIERAQVNARGDCSPASGKTSMLITLDTSTGFVKASGQSMAPVSSDALKRAHQILADDKLPEIAGNLFTDDSDTRTRLDTTEGSLISKKTPILVESNTTAAFVTASGRNMAPISSAALKRARHILADDAAPEIAGDQITDDSNTGTRLNATEDCLLASKKTPISVKPNTTTGFVKASGRSLAPLSSAALQRARLILADDTLPEIAGEQFTDDSNSETQLNATEGSLISKKTPILVVPNTTAGFVKASGQSMAPVSSAALKRARQILVDDAALEIAGDQFTDDSNTGTRLDLREDCSLVSKKTLISVKPNTTAGFVKASGQSMAPVSSAALKRARQFLTDDTAPEIAGDQFTDESDTKNQLNATEEFLISKKTPISVKPNTSAGFVTASGRNMAPISSAALKHAHQILAEDTTPESITSKQITVRDEQSENHKSTPSVEGEGSNKKFANLAASPKVDQKLQPTRASNDHVSSRSLSKSPDLYCSSSTSGRESLSPQSSKKETPSIRTNDTAAAAAQTPASTVDLKPTTINDMMEASEPDSLTALMENTQFEASMQALLRNHDLKKVDESLETRRESARAEERILIEEKLSHHTQRRTNTRSKKPTSKTTTALKISESLHCLGSIWRLRAACRRSKPAGSLASRLLKPIHELLPLSTDQSEYSLPTYTHFPLDANSWSLRTAGLLRWRMDELLSRKTQNVTTTVTYKAGDDATLIPDVYDCVGKDEIINAFFTSPSVTGQLMSRGWVTNHYDQLVWKMGTVAMRHSWKPDDKLADDYFTPHHVLLRLKYRYDRELDQAERPALRKIVEMDDTPARRLVLCVSELSITKSGEIQTMRLTDGWYQINCQPDGALRRNISLGRIRVGSKLITACAELVHVDPTTKTSSTESTNPASSRTPKSVVGDGPTGDESQFDHLIGADGAAKGVSLRLHGNSTRPAHWFTKLGYALTQQPASGAGLFATALCSLVPDGGVCAAIRVVIQRRYPLQFMETLGSESMDNRGAEPLDNSTTKSSGMLRRHTFRSERAEMAEVARHENERRRALERAMDNLLPQTKNLPRKQPTRDQLVALGQDGESLFTTVMAAPDPDEAEASLTDRQRDAIRQYKEVAVQNAIAEATPCRKVTPLLRIRVAGLHADDIALNYVVSLTIWNPSDEILAVVKEGEPVEIYKLQASTTRSTDPFAPPHMKSVLGRGQRGAIPSGTLLSLSGGRQTSIRALTSSATATTDARTVSEDSGQVNAVNENCIGQVYEPRHAVCVRELLRLCSNPADFQVPSADKNTAIEVDVRCFVVSVHHSSSDTPFRTRSEPVGRARPPATPAYNSELDSVYVTDMADELDELNGSMMAVVKVWGGLQAQQLTGLIQKGQAVLFTDLQLRPRQHLQVLPSFDAPEGCAPLVCLNYTAASYVTVDKSRRPATMRNTMGSRTSKKTTPIAKDVSLLDRLSQSAETHWAGRGLPSGSNWTNSPLLRRSVGQMALTHSHHRDSPSPAGYRFGPGLSSLLQNPPPQSAATAVNQTPEATSRSALTTIQTPTIAAPSIETIGNDVSTPLRRLPVKTTPRTGLSRRVGTRSIRCATSSIPVTPVPPSVPELSRLAHTPLPKSDARKPTTPLRSIDTGAVTPEPRAKRRRTLVNSPASTLSSPLGNKENRAELKSANKQSPDLLRSPIYSSLASGGAPSSPSSWDRGGDSLPFSDMDSLDESQLDVSIADLVKCRRRQSQQRQPTSSTPTRQHSKRAFLL